jgi:ribosome biogenesis GTPase
MMDLQTLGWSLSLEQQFAEFRAKGYEAARIATEDKHHYMALAAQGDLSAQAAGKLLHSVRSPADLPKVGDWVAVSVLSNEAKAVIHHVLPRRTKLSRKVPGRETEEQVIVTNIDLAFVVHALDGSFNPRRMQRHVVMVYESGAKPVVVLNKVDLCASAAEALAQAQRDAGETPVIEVSARTGQGVEQLSEFIQPGVTAVFIGSSGVGKSSLINRLYGEEIQPTLDVREWDLKGRHATTWREMILLPKGGLVIDTPGTREFHMWVAEDGLQEAFPEIEGIATRCRFRDCQHTVETKCAVRDAVDSGQLPRERYETYLKLRKEVEGLEEAQRKRAFLNKKRQTKTAQRAFNKIKRRGE